MTQSKMKRTGLLLTILGTVSLMLIAATGVVAIPRSEKIPLSEQTEPIELPSDVPVTSHRLIVELGSPALVEWSVSRRALPAGRLDVNSPEAQSYIAQLEQEQQVFVDAMQRAVPNATVASFIDENGFSVNAAYQVVFNGVAVDAGQESDPQAVRDDLLQLANVKAVYFDYAYNIDTYSSMPLINAPAVWSASEIGGIENAGAGILFASVDTGIHHNSPMFSGDGWSYPEGFPEGGIGDSANNNGKIVASRAYFRDWDPPLAGDEKAWPGESGSSHGPHTASTAVGNQVTTELLGSGVEETVSGVAPGAWAMSYKTFYPTNSSFSGSAFSIELIAATEDAVADGAHVINNSWGGGPGSYGGEFDALDKALVNAVEAGVFVSMSAGNAGPGLGTGDHPSDEYINVAASTSGGTYAAGRLSVTAPDPVPDNLIDMPFGTSAFGPPIDVGQVLSYTFAAAFILEAPNFEGCLPFATADFTGKAALISRGGCEFSTKVLNAQNAGAEFVIVHNNQGGDAILNMAAGIDAPLVTIPSIFIGEFNGVDAVLWHETHGDASQLTFDTRGFQAGNDPDVIADFSSRGPSAGQGLKPDIAAPGVNILAQGYDTQATGEARHFGYGQVSGTSMASPHVAGAAVIMRQLYPDWDMAQIKAGLMGSAKYMEIYNGDGSPAQPLDMGAGRLDFTQIVSPGIGVLLNPPSLSMGYVTTGTTHSMQVQLVSVISETETYDLSTLYTGDSFTATTSLPGFTVEPASVTLAPGESAMVTVMFDAAAGQGLGDNQGYLIVDGATYDSHAAMWARVQPDQSEEILIIDADFSSELGNVEYLGYYVSALDELGLSYTIYDTLNGVGLPATIPSATEMAAYKAVILFTGDHFQPNGTFNISTALTELDMNRLTEYANSGGLLIAMGQDLAAVVASAETNEGEFFYETILGADWLQDSVTGFVLPTLPVVAAPDAPAALDGAWLDLSQGSQGFDLAGSTDNSGFAAVAYNPSTNQLSYLISVDAFTSTLPISVTAAHIHTGTVGVTGGVAINLNIDPILITDTAVIANGTVTLTDQQETTMLEQGYYINVHTADFPAGEMRGQIPAVNGDGSSNQAFIDEIRIPRGSVLDGATGFQPLMVYPSPGNVEDGIVAMYRRDQPSLERPGLSSNVRTIYTTFGLEGVNDGIAVDRSALLGLFLDMLMDEPTATLLSATDSFSSTTQAVFVTAELSSDITGTVASNYRWDFGDGTPIVDTDGNNMASHQYAEEACGSYPVRVEITDSLGNVALAEQLFGVCDGILLDSPALFLPMTWND